MIKFRVWNELLELYIPKEIVDKLTLKELNKKGYIVEQFTGLQDKNGKDIYAGDIVTGNYRNLTGEYKGVGLVEMGNIYDSDGWSHELTYGWLAGDNSLADLVNHKVCEVIGNINENKELLENEK